MKLMSIYKEKKRRLKYRYNTRMFSIKSWVLLYIIGNDVVSDYAIDNDLLYDYYNEPPEPDDRWNDRD